MFFSLILHFIFLFPSWHKEMNETALLKLMCHEYFLFRLWNHKKYNQLDVTLELKKSGILLNSNMAVPQVLTARVRHNTAMIFIGSPVIA